MQVYVLSAVPPRSSRLLQKYGLLSAEYVIKHPDVLKAARPDAKQRKAFVKKVGEVITSDRPYSVMGPSVFFTTPDPDKITDKHFIKQWDLQTIRIDLSRLMEDYPETVVWGAELLPYDYAWRKMSDEEFEDEIADLGFSSWEEYADERSRPLTLDEVYGFTQADPVDLWEHYHKSDVGKKYASNVPHAFIITPMGYIPYEYIEYVDNARSNPELRTDLGVINYEVYTMQFYNDLQKRKLLGEYVMLDYENCFDLLDGLKELLSRVDCVAKVGLVEKVDNAPLGTGELLYKSMFEDIAKQHKGKAVLIVSASCDKMPDSTNYPAWKSAYRAAGSSSEVTKSEFVFEDYYECSECYKIYTHSEMPELEECCDTWLGEDPSYSIAAYYILIGEPLSKYVDEARMNPRESNDYRKNPRADVTTEKVRELYDQGLTTAQIATELNTSYATVKNRLTLLGVKLPQKRGRKPLFSVEDIRRLREEGKTKKQIAEALGVSMGAVGSKLGREGLTLSDLSPEEMGGFSKSAGVPRMKSRPDVTEAAVVALWEQGLTTLQIARELNTSPVTVRSRMTPEMRERKAGRKRVDVSMEDVRRLRAEGMTQEEISAELGVHKDVLRRKLKDQGVSLSDLTPEDVALGIEKRKKGRPTSVIRENSETLTDAGWDTNGYLINPNDNWVSWWHFTEVPKLEFNLGHKETYFAGSPNVNFATGEFESYPYMIEVRIKLKPSCVIFDTKSLFGNVPSSIDEDLYDAIADSVTSDIYELLHYEPEIISEETLEFFKHVPKSPLLEGESLAYVMSLYLKEYETVQHFVNKNIKELGPHIAGWFEVERFGGDTNLGLFMDGSMPNACSGAKVEVMARKMFDISY